MVDPLETFKNVMVEMGVCQFNVVLNTGGGFMVLIS